MAAKRKPSYRLTSADAVEVWRRYWAGEYQNRIAAFFDVNQGRISEIITGKAHCGSEAAARRST
jgi:hypothetical protein